MRSIPTKLSDAPPDRKVWPYLKSHLWPLRRILVVSVVVTALAASVEVWLIQYAGTVIDMLASSSPRQLWETQGTGLLAAALVVLLFRPFCAVLAPCRQRHFLSMQCSDAGAMARLRSPDPAVGRLVPGRPDGQDIRAPCGHREPRRGFDTQCPECRGVRNCLHGWGGRAYGRRRGLAGSALVGLVRPVPRGC